MKLTNRGYSFIAFGVTLVFLVIMGVVGYVETLGYW